MMTVTKIARRFNVSAETIRHYTKLGLLSPETDATNGYRRYGIKDERRLRFLLAAKKLGFSLKDISQILEMAAPGDTPCPLVKRLIDQRLEAARREMLDALGLLQRMESASNVWNALPDRPPSGDSVCYLIESWDSPSNPIESLIQKTA